MELTSSCPVFPPHLHCISVKHSPFHIQVDLPASPSSGWATGKQGHVTIMYTVHNRCSINAYSIQSPRKACYADYKEFGWCIKTRHMDKAMGFLQFWQQRSTLWLSEDRSWITTPILQLRKLRSKSPNICVRSQMSTRVHISWLPIIEGSSPSPFKINSPKSLHLGEPLLLSSRPVERG